MHDLKRIRDNEAEFRQALANKNSGADLDTLLALDRERRQILTDVERMKNERNTVSKQIGIKKKNGEDISGVQVEMRALGDRIAECDKRVAAVEEKLQELLLTIPNTPHSSVPVGSDAAANRTVRTHGAVPTFDFQPKPHWEIAERLHLIDFARATRMSGAGFLLYTGWGAKLERALYNFMLDLHTSEHGYREIAPPFVVNSATMTGTGQLPKARNDMYHVPTDDLWLIPTAEVPVTNIYREDTIPEPLPLKLCAYTPCFRREAGAAGRETRGMIRVHQFDKVELVKFVEPQTSYDELELLVKDAEDVLQRLRLPYRVLLLCSGDMSFAAAKCYDIELWAPGQNGWLEVSSCSNFEDFQARRAQIKYRNADGKLALCHTLNGSGVALARLYVAILENYQQADGSVIIPEALRPYLGGKERFVPGEK